MAGTWQPFVSNRKSRLLAEGVAEVLSDLQADRAGLWHEGSAHCSGHGWHAFLDRVHGRCFCGRGKQTRWHVLTECPGNNSELDACRQEQLGWLLAHAQDFNTREVEHAISALQDGGQGLSVERRVAATWFLCGLPFAPSSEESTHSIALQRGLAKKVYANTRIVLAVRTRNAQLEAGDDGATW